MDRHMKFSMFMFLGVVLIILAACTTKSGEQVAVKEVPKEGYIILRNDTVFLAEDKTFETKVELQNYIEQQINKEHPSHTVLSFKDKSAYNQLKTGDKIKVWSSQTLESYPAKMIVEKFEIVEK
ncbi:DUF3221 domain-containing protein [Bacillus cereus group sp. Bc002]|uniref:DUF3221 domain-containing protein n=1 Tax=Bacillus cereus group TaxID=86661 RepID=UPI0009372D3D|nr:MULTISPECIES: DUF3221 domain-containing protein [Bacillus cereus group]ASI79912.1 hypothetical protein BA202_22535 [Bacillus cereus]MCC2469735.1 YobA family protein [Bacillus pacificus]MCC2481349.1 YobA family protein [Bacillus pacificus]MDA1607255.1 DUF3221 domain-containing protein [Bacillus cereus group sp. TH208-1LC]MDA2781593.1 DUF3221 domain-containing protein [Bacillus cereus group sp. Bc002]